MMKKSVQMAMGADIEHVVSRETHTRCINEPLRNIRGCIAEIPPNIGDAYIGEYLVNNLRYIHQL